MVSLIVGLGNPGSKYAQTRHNLGAMTVRGLADRRGWKFKKEETFKSEVASGKVGDQSVILILPQTFMNLSGQAVKRVVDYYKIPLSELLVVVDDIYLDFGVMRLRMRGSTGGHNGLEDIENALRSPHYARLRMGIGLHGGEDERRLEDYVLSPFNEQEQKELEGYLDRAVDVLEVALTKSIEAALQLAAKKVT